MKVKILAFRDFLLPKRAHENDAGADVFSPSRVCVPPNTTVKIPLGFGLEIPDGYAGFIFPRSGLSAKGIVCELPPIDSGYRSEVHAIVSNMNDRLTYEISTGDRIGQLIILPVVIADFVTEHGEQRGTGAFGSTGK